MRVESEIAEMFEKHMAKCLSKRFKEFLSRSPKNCTYNQSMRLREKGTVGFCQCADVLEKARGQVFVCDTDEIAGRCSYFNCKNTRDGVKKEFEEILRSPERCGEEYPKLAVLIWVLMKNCSVDLSISIRKHSSLLSKIKGLFNRG